MRFRLINFKFLVQIRGLLTLTNRFFNHSQTVTISFIFNQEYFSSSLVDSCVCNIMHSVTFNIESLH